MPQGLRVWDTSGNLVLDVSDRIMTVLGRIEITSSTPGGTVSITDSRLALGDRWFFKTTNGGGWGGACSVTVSFTSSTITVAVDNPAFIPASLFVTYGVY